MFESCPPEHDWAKAGFSFLLIFGLLISYLPQHYRIISNGSSEGLSPWFLLLGSTSWACGMLNIWIMQWNVIKCCHVYNVGTCLEKTAAVTQVSLPWVLFTAIFVLYMIYYPLDLRYKTVSIAPCEYYPNEALTRTQEWRLSLILAYVTAAHFVCCTFATFFLLLTEPTSPDGSLSSLTIQWATILGVSSATLAAIQYIPQLRHTWNDKLVGALSIPMMCIQSPGAVLMVLGVALSPGTNWTSWITFAVAGIMQGTLLVMCLCWKVRQNRLGIDDFGQPLYPVILAIDSDTDDDVPGLVTAEGEDLNQIKNALAAAIESAVEDDIRIDGRQESPSHPEERTPLLPHSSDSPGRLRRWFGF